MSEKSKEYKSFDKWVRNCGYDRVDADLVFYKVAEYLLEAVELKISQKMDFSPTDEWDVGYKAALDSMLQYIRDLKQRGDNSH
jgi:hypothetical protein